MLEEKSTDSFLNFIHATYSYMKQWSTYKELDAITKPYFLFVDKYTKDNPKKCCRCKKKIASISVLLEPSWTTCFDCRQEIKKEDKEREIEDIEREIDNRNNRIKNASRKRSIASKIKRYYSFKMGRPLNAEETKKVKLGRCIVCNARHGIGRLIGGECIKCNPNPEPYQKGD